MTEQRLAFEFTRQEVALIALALQFSMHIENAVGFNSVFPGAKALVYDIACVLGQSRPLDEHQAAALEASNRAAELLAQIAVHRILFTAPKEKLSVQENH
jgi:hypothetical protein